MTSPLMINNKERHLNGWRRDRPDHRDFKLSISKLKAIFLPKKVDLRAHCSRIENQGDLGSCTANSATSAIEYLYKKQSRPQPELSRLFLYFATRVWIAGEHRKSDNGAMLRDVMKALAKHGVCIEALWPYAPMHFFSPPSPAAMADAKHHHILHYYRCPSLRYIKTSLAEGYPCVGGFAVPASIDGAETATSGIVQYPGPKEDFVGGHAVLFVGYDDEKKLLTFQNSWGIEWGDGGFGYLPYDFVTNGLANDFWTVRQAQM